MTVSVATAPALPRSSRQKRRQIELYETQYQFRHSPALYRGFVGGRGSGKTFVGAYDLLVRAKPGRTYGLYAPSYVMLRDASMFTFVTLARQLGMLKTYRRTEKLITLLNGARVICRSLDDPDSARGPNLSGAWMDEASQVKEAAYNIIQGSLREAGEMGWLSATFTARGKQHWTYRVFGIHGRPNTVLFQSSTANNPFLPPDFYKTLVGQYTSTLAAQELEGMFIDLSGSVVERGWFQVTSDIPAGMKLHRHWDFSASRRKRYYRRNGLDWTVGLLMGTNGSGQYYILDIIREQVSPGQIQALLRQTALLDGYDVSISVEQEPGASGVLLTDAIVTALAGWEVTGLPVNTNKEARAMPFLSAAEAGNIYLKAARWNEDFLDEISAFPGGVHDDQVDAASGAYTYLARSTPIVGAVGFVF